MFAAVNGFRARSARRNELSTIASARRLSRPLDVPGARGFLLGFSGTLLLGLLTTVAISFAIGIANEGRVLPLVRVGDIELGGLDRAAAATRLDASLPQLTDSTLTLAVNGQSFTLWRSDLGRRYDTRAMVNAAYGVGRAGNPALSAVGRIQDAANGTTLLPVVREYDPALLDWLVLKMIVASTTDPMNASVTHNPDGTFVVHPARSGSRFDAGAVRQAIATALTSHAGDVTVALPVTPVAPAVTTDAAQAAASTASAIAGTPLRFTDGHDRFTLSPAQLAALVEVGRDASGKYTAQIDQTAVRGAVIALGKHVDRKATDASYSWGARLTVVPALTGRKLDQAATFTQLMAALAARANGAGSSADLQLSVAVTQPKFSTASAQASVGNIVRIGTWTTYYFPGVSNGFGANIDVPAHALDGKVIAPGANFDFWRDIGPVTVAAGYRYGGAIINGRSEPTGAFAGGICSASTTMFNAALRAGLQMGERWNHYYYISRYPVGLDATVFEDDSGHVWSMGFTNDTPYPIIIRSFTSYGVVTFSLYSVPNGRTVSFSTPIITNPVAAHDTVQYTTSLPPGVQERVEGVYNGFDAQVTRYVRDASGALIHTDTFYSHYYPVNGVLLIGVAG
jgi:vancomycin resistance protein YoaR